MKRICFFVLVISSFLTACNNDLKTIGQDIINNGNYIGEDVLNVNNTATIRIDSFLTSSGIYASSSISQLILGQHKEEYGGTTTAIPCFQIAPTFRPNIGHNAALDSVTFHFRFGGALWGDTLYNLSLQKFYLHRLKGLPELDYEDNGYFYNTSPVHFEATPIGSTVFFPKKSNINKAYFKIDEDLGETLFEKMIYRDEDDIYLPNSSSTPFLRFLQYFKGLAIVPDAANNCLMSISALSDSLYLQFNYKESGTAKVIRFPISQREYQYNQILTKRSNALASLQKQEDEVSFESAGSLALAQGLAGYMVKLVLPQPPRHGHYSTIIKAELEIKPEYFKNNPISYPKQMVAYTTDDLNRITGVLTQNGTTNVTGVLRPDEQAPSNTRYVFDLTEYYQKMSTNPPLNKDPEILLSIPDLSLSYNYMVVRKIPTIKIYYANYRQ